LKEDSNLKFQDLIHSGNDEDDRRNEETVQVGDTSTRNIPDRSPSPVKSNFLNQIPFVGPGASFVTRRTNSSKSRGRGKGRGRASNVLLNEEPIPSHLTRESRLARRTNALAKKP
jgi:hypothetical protein